jgi:hypothetical protein
MNVSMYAASTMHRVKLAIIGAALVPIGSLLFCFIMVRVLQK